MKVKTLFGGLALALVFCGLMSAGPLTWTLNNVTVDFNGVESVTGSFVYDADTNTFSSLNITTSGTSVIIPSTSSWVFNTNAGGTERNDNGVSGFSAVDSLSGDETGAHFLSLFSFSGPIMTNAGGTINLNFLFIGTCGNADCSLVDQGEGSSRSGSGQFTATATAAAPEPSTLVLAGSLSLIFFACRRLRRRQA